ncbi:S8 family serine peptidase [Rothia sp. P5764]|uniref:S8 family serine peptidase n=1 Tax=Rothia sp. P5764 TaxID=3402654 RepID=UPI003AC38B56
MKTTTKKPLILSVTVLMLSSLCTDLPAYANNNSDIQHVVEKTDENTTILGATDRLIVTLKDENTNKDALAHEASNLTNTVDNTTLIKDQVADDTSTIVLETDTLLTPQEQSETIAQLETDPRIESVEPDRLVKAISASPTTEPYYPRLWAFSASYLSPNTAWTKGYTGKGQTVAIIDTGFSYHPDLKTPIASYDFVSSTALSRDGNGRDSDARDVGNNDTNANWHGTFIHGQIAAQINGQGITGIAPDAEIIMARALGDKGLGYESDMADAIIWSAGGTINGVPNIPRPATVINASFAWPSATCSPTMSKAINYALNRNIPVVVAAGNNAVDAAGISPANCYRAIVVGASTSWGTLTAYSNYGSTLDVLAPGGTTGNDIFSTTNTGYSSIGSPTYGTKNGTSMSTPYVSGTIALMRQANPGMTIEQIRQTLVSTGKAVGPYRQIDTGAATTRAVAMAPAPVSTYSLIPGSGIEAAYWRYGGRAVFGEPTSSEFRLRGGAAAQNFSNGRTLYWSASKGAHPVYWRGGIGAKYKAGGFENRYGYPLFGETGIPGGAMQKFATASGAVTAFYWTPSHHRTHTVWENGGIGSRFTREGGTGTYGFPSEDETPIYHGYRQIFASGTTEARFYWAPNTGTKVVNGRGAIFARWVGNGGIPVHGFPATDEVEAGAGGVTQLFRTAHGVETVYTWSPGTGTHTLYGRGAIYWHWRNNGFTSVYGYPVTDEAYVGNGVYQVRFSSGRAISWSAARGIF